MHGALNTSAAYAIPSVVRFTAFSFCVLQTRLHTKSFIDQIMRQPRIKNDKFCQQTAGIKGERNGPKLNLCCYKS